MFRKHCNCVLMSVSRLLCLEGLSNYQFDNVLMISTVLLNVFLFFSTLDSQSSQLKAMICIKIIVATSLFSKSVIFLSEEMFPFRYNLSLFSVFAPLSIFRFSLDHFHSQSISKTFPLHITFPYYGLFLYASFLVSSFISLPTSFKLSILHQNSCRKF